MERKRNTLFNEALDDYFSEGEEEKNPTFESMTIYIGEQKDFKIELNEYMIIEEGFRETWNLYLEQDIQLVDYITGVKQYISEYTENNEFLQQVSDEIIAKTVYLMLEYMAHIGQYIQPEDV